MMAGRASNAPATVEPKRMRRSFAEGMKWNLAAGSIPSSMTLRTKFRATGNRRAASLAASNLPEVLP
jgi:hypothetical protein